MADFSIDGGAPPLEPEDELRADDEAQVIAPPSPGLGDRVLEWETGVVATCLSCLVFLPLRFTVGRQGPPDAFMPDRAERREMAEPIANVLNQFGPTRALAPFGNAIAAVGGLGGYLQLELRRVADFQAGRAYEPRPDEDLDDVAMPRERSPQFTPPAAAEPGPVRGRWRPPAYTDPGLA